MRIALLLGLAPAVWACGGEAVPESAPAADPAVRGVVADTATVTAPLVLQGQLYVEHDAVLYARARGIVQSVHADLGTAVGRGDTLARLESADQEIALEEARARLASAERVVQRARSLAGTGVVAAADSEQAELAYSDATLAARRAQREYELTRVIAPFRGLVTQRLARPGRLVEAGDPLFRVAARAPLLVSVHVPEGPAGTIRVGDEGLVVGLDGTRRPGRVIRAAPMVDPASGTREVVLQVPSAPGFAPGVSVQVQVGDERRPAVVIPAELLADSGHVLVWAAGRSELRAVTVGATLPDGRVAITQGLVAGERVVHP